MTIINLNAMGNNSEKLKKNTIKISPEFASNLIFGKIEEVNDDLVGNSNGDGDGIVDAGETIEFRISLENIGSNDATSVNATISCLDTQINIIKSNQTFLTIFANQSGISSSYYIFSINSSINCSTKIPFLLNISSLEGNWNDIFEIEIIGTINLSYYMYSVQSESNGDLIADNDRIIDAGEIIDFNVYVKNLGEAKGSNVMGKISTSDIYVSIIGDICLFGSIAPENHGFGNFKIRISGSIPDKHTVWFLLNLTDDFNSEWNLYFKVIINGIPNFEIIDVNFFESYGNGDKELDAGEFWYPFITLNNTGSAISSSTFIIFSSSSPYVLFFSDISNRNMSIGSVCAGQTINQTFLSNNYYYWAFKISSKIPKDYLIPFSCLIFNQNFQISWNISFTKKSIGIANYEIINISFKELSGNSDAIMDPSETWVPIINIRNIGKGAGFSVSVFFNISDLFISFSHTANFRNRSLGNLLSGENKTLNGQDINLMSSYYWAFTILDNIPINYSLEYQIFISDESEEIKMTEKGTLIINSHGSNVNSSDLDVLSSFLAILVVLICGIGVVSCYNSSQKDDEEKKNIQSDYLPELARITPSTLKLQINEIPPLYQPHDEKTETFFDDSNDFNLDDYEILHNIAQGGMGEILLIREKNLGQLFAMKHLFVESYNGVENCKKYWIQEQKILQIQSKSPVRALQYKSAFKLNNRSNSTDFYILTEYLQGITLEEWIKKKPEILSNYEIAYRLRNIILPLTIHLNFIHSQGIIHRDITPRNIMIITDNSKIIPVLIDWGVAKIDQNDRIERPASNTKATTIVSMGNPPEILAGLEPVIASDIYMLGNIMYYILSAGEIIIPYRESDYPLDISKINSTLPFDLIQLIKDMTHFSSSNRIQPTMKIIHTIEQILLHFESSE